MKELQSEIEINAPAERVWEVLADFASYPRWNPFICWTSGVPRTGNTGRWVNTGAVDLALPGASFSPYHLVISNQEVKGRGANHPA